MSAKKIINYLGIFTVFSESLSFSNNTFFEIRCAYFILLFLVLLLLPYLCKIYFSKWFIFVFIVLIALSLQNVYLGNNRFSLLTKQILGISFFSLFFYLLVKFNNEDVFGLFKIYLRIAFFIGLIGLIQEIAFFLSLEWLYNYSHILPKWRLPLRDVQNFFRVNSIMP